MRFWGLVFAFVSFCDGSNFANSEKQCPFDRTCPLARAGEGICFFFEFGIQVLSIGSIVTVDYHECTLFSIIIF